ncbi:MAG: proline--tRNA ligase [Clostridiaceae bacterium]|jgi:prolyl-tRNA synthetase|nr:proline--tRNA ligase [Clostridiaceae bacterium]
MKLSKLVIETLKNPPSDVRIISHALLIRAGYIKQVANGIYSLATPTQKMALNIESIIREEMNNVDGQEVKFPVAMPRELWELSGRYQSIGSEMIRFKDRGDRDMVLGMTHEEAAVHFAMNTVNSYARLPFMIYQIQTKFRDEPRPRGGLIRVREFTMKDAYSFHFTQEDLDEYYYKQHRAYENIFRRIGMKNFISVKSDTGMMGGSVAHEFMLITPDGEDELVLCDTCGYKSNMEVAEAEKEVFTDKKNQKSKEVFTGEAKTIDEVSAFLGIPATSTVKAVVYAVKGDAKPVIIFIRGDLEINEAKLRSVLKKNVFPYESAGNDDFSYGNIGPVGLVTDGTVIYDESLCGRENMVTGANKSEYHITGISVKRDIKPAAFSDVAKVKIGQKCKCCGGELKTVNGIEIGNIFQLGTKYTKSMEMTVLNEKGEAVYPIMGCYGIGVGRAIASVLQESFDKDGMILPVTIAPWKVHVCPLRLDDENVRTQAFGLYDALNAAGIETIIDDRNASPGFKFADADLMGMPVRVVISPKSLSNGGAEIKIRKSGEVRLVTLDNLLPEITSILAALYAELK